MGRLLLNTLFQCTIILQQYWPQHLLTQHVPSTRSMNHIVVVSYVVTTGNNNNNNDRLTAFDPGQPG